VKRNRLAKHNGRTNLPGKSTLMGKWIKTFIYFNM